MNYTEYNGSRTDICLIALLSFVLLLKFAVMAVRTVFFRRSM